MSGNTYKVSDTFPYFEETLNVSLVDATVRFRVEEPESENLTVNAIVQIVKEADGTVRYEWTENDLPTEGTYLGEFFVEWADGRQRHFPSGDSYYRIEVGEPLTGDVDTSQWANEPIDVTVVTAEELRGYSTDPVLLGSDLDAQGNDLQNVGETDTTRLVVDGTVVYFGTQPTDPEDGAIWIGRE